MERFLNNQNRLAGKLYIRPQYDSSNSKSEWPSQETSLLNSKDFFIQGKLNVFTFHSRNKVHFWSASSFPRANPSVCFRQKEKLAPRSDSTFLDIALLVPPILIVKKNRAAALIRIPLSQRRTYGQPKATF
jgi:hypothetical protein